MSLDRDPGELAALYQDFLIRVTEFFRDPTAFDVVPPRFTLAELKHAYEVIGGRTLTPSIFRKLVVDRDLVIRATAKPTKKKTEQLYRWNRPR